MSITLVGPEKIWGNESGSIRYHPQVTGIFPILKNEDNTLYFGINHNCGWLGLRASGSTLEEIWNGGVSGNEYIAGLMDDSYAYPGNLYMAENLPWHIGISGIGYARNYIGFYEGTDSSNNEYWAFGMLTAQSEFLAFCFPKTGAVSLAGINRIGNESAILRWAVFRENDSDSPRVPSNLTIPDTLTAVPIRIITFYQVVIEGTRPNITYTDYMSQHVTEDFESKILIYIGGRYWTVGRMGGFFDSRFVEVTNMAWQHYSDVPRIQGIEETCKALWNYRSALCGEFALGCPKWFV